MNLRIDQQAKGVRIITGEEARERRALLNRMISLAEEFGAEEIILPSLEPSALYTDKAGKEILGQMYTFPSKGENPQQLCLRPEGTATVQALARENWDGARKCVWYFERCWRYERPQAGRYREFFQFGVEWLNPKWSKDATVSLIELAKKMVELRTRNYEVQESVKRGLAYYTDGGFEISCPELGAQKQVCGGGPYDEGIGFAIGFDRLMLVQQ